MDGTVLFDDLSLVLMLDGSVLASHTDSRNDPGGDYSTWNLWLERGS